MAKRHRAPVTGPSSLPLAAPFAVLALLLSPACRADWKVVPSVDLRQTYSDNARLEADEFARSQFITDVGPSIAVSNNGPRLKLRGVFSAHLYGYSNKDIEGLNRSQRQLSGDARAKLIDDLLFVDGAASSASAASRPSAPRSTTTATAAPTAPK
jgi:uncharacterized protein (PEP-CTERM system associated)